MSLKNGFGMWLRNEREARGMSMAALAHKVGITYTHISKIEVGRAHPSREMVRLIARALGADIRMALIVARLLPPEFRGLTDRRLQTLALNFPRLPADAQDAIMRIAASGACETPRSFVLADGFDQPCSRVLADVSEPPRSFVLANGSEPPRAEASALLPASESLNGVENASRFFGELPFDILEISVLIAEKMVELSKNSLKV